MRKKSTIKILIVENNRPMRTGLEGMLFELGFRGYISVMEAGTAWKKIEKEEIDIVFCSLDLPQASGLDLLNRVRKSKKYFNLPFVIIAGEDQRVAILNMLEYEADYYLIKPFTAQTLGTMMERIIGTLSSPSRYDLAIYAGKYYYINKDLEKARKSFSIAIQINPEAALPYMYLGNIYCRLDDLQEAEGCYKKAINIQPDYLGALTGLTDIYHKQGNYQQLVFYLEKIIENSSPDFNNFLRLGRALLQLKDFDRSRKYLEKSARMARGNAEKLVEVMETFIEAGFVQEADDLFSKYFEEDDDKTADFLNRLGRKCVLIRQYEKGKAFLLSGLKLRPQHQGLNYTIAFLFYHLKEYDAAKAHLQKVLRLNPDFAEAKKMLTRMKKLTENG